MPVSDISSLVKATRPVIPQIYAYTTPGYARHDGWTKIGYTEQSVTERIKQQTHTADVDVHLEWHANAAWEDGSGTFKDIAFHNYLTALGINRKDGTEWFQINPTPAKRHFYDFRENHGVLATESVASYQLRYEQAEAVRKTMAFARTHDHGEFLWNAKPRFGKTLTSYDFIKSLGAKRVLIVTNRPAIANSWYDDYVRFIGTASGYTFVSSVSSLTGRPHCLSRAEYDAAAARKDVPDGLIEFVSLQDLKGSIYLGGSHDKLRVEVDEDWDVLIVDEAHEGVDTLKTDTAFDHITRSFTLHLSGTPFKAIANEKFTDEAIYNWTYADEQQAKQDWDDPELHNPYEELPRLSMFTYQMSEVIEDELRRGAEIDGEQAEYAFDLNEFFSTNDNGQFTHDKDVNRFLDALTSQRKFPFSTTELRDELRHTFWLLNRVDSARALARKLKQHPVFKDYEVVLAAGDGKLDDADETAKAFDRVRAAIGSHDRTITLSVGQLTTGVTIPEWTAVLMLSSMRSPALYMQAAFRAQNPWLDTREGISQRKENAYVFDFDPARTLSIVEQFANDLYADTAAGGGDVDARKQRIRRLLNFFPVIGEDEDGEMVELSAEQVLSVPRKIRSQQVVRRGFMSDFLFQNISGVFRAPATVIDLIQQFVPYKAPNNDLGIDRSTADDLSLNEYGDVDVSDELVVGTAAGLLGRKRYQVEEELSTVINEATTRTPSNTSEDQKYIDDLIKKFDVDLSQPLIETIKLHYGSSMRPAQERKIQRRIRADIESEVKKKVNDFSIRRNVLTKDRDDALAGARTDEERTKIARDHANELARAHDQLREDLNAAKDELIRQTGETVVREVETARREQQKQSLENAIRDHLRGFSRTIPSFLMAYGDEDTTLETFDAIIPPRVFEEVTSITLDQFRLLRDGGTIHNPETGESEHFAGQLFDPVVFNDSVQEFIRLRTALTDYFDESLTEDIFDYVPPQKNNQIFTPRRVVIEMLDLFEQENPGCFDDPSHTFADLYMKSGLYITEVIKRLYNSAGMRKHFPNDRDRLRHILENQVFGIAPTEIIYRIATHFILGYHNEHGQGCNTNFVIADSAEMAKNGELAAFVESTFGDKLSEEAP